MWQEGPCPSQLLTGDVQNLVAHQLHVLYMYWLYLQVSVVPFDEYVVPEGCQVKQGSRSERNRAKYTSRYLQNGSTVLPAEGADPVDV